MRLILKNFLFVLKRFKVSSALNILGLSLAFAVFFVIVVQIRYDFGFNRNFGKTDNIYLLTKYWPHSDVRWTTTNTGTPKTIAARFPEVKNYCFLEEYAKQTFDVQDDGNNRHEFEEMAVCASAGIMDMFTPEVIAGDARQAFTEPGRAMLSESVAKKFFGNSDPLGKTFSSHERNEPITVVAVCRDFPDNCSLSNGIYMMQAEDVDSEWSYTSYLEISGRDRDKILTALNNEASVLKDGEEEWVFELTALPDIHLKFPAKGKGSMSTTVSLLATGILLLIIAYINFVNFYVAMAPVRLKSFNIRRIMGENPFFLKFSIAMEAVLTSLTAAVISTLFIYCFSAGAVREFFQADISLSKNPELFLLMSAFFLTAGFAAGIYPALYSTAFKPAMAVSGLFLLSTGSKILKNTLVVIQFAASVILITVSCFVRIQHDYMQDKSWGIKKENVVYLRVWPLRDNILVFQSELMKNPEILDLACSAFLPGEERPMNWQRTFEGVEVKMVVCPVSPNYLHFFGINIVEGRDFEIADMSGNGRYIFNRTFVKKYGFGDITGKDLYGHDAGKVIGIMEDFNFESLREPVRPIAFVTGLNYMNRFAYMLVRINGQNTAETLDYMHNLCKQFSNEPVEIAFLDETLHQLYKQENNLAELILIFGLITVIVTVMGVYGLILFNVKSKRKTIAIHKINGASITEIIMMLNRGFTVRFVIAYIVAVPLAYLIVSRWLENFAYKTPVHWWIFAAVGILIFTVTALTVSWQSWKAAVANPADGIKVD
jgi:putative ABC transport system permease protein